MSNLFIPKRIKVGFQKRSDTYTGQLGYVIYFDEKNKLRKEVSFNGWIDKSIPTIEFDNTPKSHFVINKGVKREGYWHHSGRSMIRVYDSRDFEFEISINNMIEILMCSDVSKRDIQEECVFAWEGKELILLPVNSEEYQTAMQYTQKLDKKVSAKTLIEGATYSCKKSDEKLIYMGSMPCYSFEYASRKQHHIVNAIAKANNFHHTPDIAFSKLQLPLGKKHVFFSESSKKFELTSVSSLAECMNTEPVDNFAELLVRVKNSLGCNQAQSISLGKESQKICDWSLETVNVAHGNTAGNSFFKQKNNSISMVRINFNLYGKYEDESTLVNQQMVSADTYHFLKSENQATLVKVWSQVNEGIVLFNKIYAQVKNVPEVKAINDAFAEQKMKATGIFLHFNYPNIDSHRHFSKDSLFIPYGIFKAELEKEEFTECERDSAITFNHN